MSDCMQFEAAAQALINLSTAAPASLQPCFEALLAEGALRRVLKESADVGCGVLIAVLVALDRAGVQLDKKLQESVSKVSCSPCMHVAVLARWLSEAGDTRAQWGRRHTNKHSSHIGVVTEGV